MVSAGQKTLTSAQLAALLMRKSGTFWRSFNRKLFEALQDLCSTVMTVLSVSAGYRVDRLLPVRAVALPVLQSGGVPAVVSLLKSSPGSPTVELQVCGTGVFVRQVTDGESARRKLIS